MRLVVRDHGTERIPSASVTVTGDVSLATVADLRAALGGEPGPVWTDGRELAADTPLPAAGLLDGDVVDLSPPRGAERCDTDSPPTVGVLVVIAGHGSTRRLELHPGVHVLGRAADADLRLSAPSISRRHARITVGREGSVVVADLDSRNGTFVDGAAAGPETHGSALPLRGGGIVQVGAVALRLMASSRAEPVSLDACGEISGLALHRPPRPPGPEVPVVRIPPAADPPVSRTTEQRWAMLLAPVLMGIVLAAVWDPRLALLALLSPVMFLGTWAEDRWRSSRAERVHAAEVLRRRRRLRQRLEVAATAARTRREHDDPDLGVRAGWAAHRTGRLWERRGHEALRIVVGLGSGRLPLSVPGGLAGPAGGGSREEEMLEAAGTGARLPVAVDLDEAPLGIVGPAAAGRAVLRAVLLAATTGAGPADLTVAVVGGDPAGWRWTAWLPHHVQAGGATTGDGAHRLLVVDGTGAARDGRLREHLEAGGVAVVRTDDRGSLPAACGQVLTVDEHGVATLSGDAAPEDATSEGAAWEGADTDVLVPLVGRRRAEEIARRLAPLRDPETTTAGIPPTVRLPPLLDLPAGVPEAAVRRRWSDTRSADHGLPVVLGVDTDGPVRIDLAEHGPHVLIGGMTGAGKSELLRTLVAAASATLGPDRLNILLVDYKGGSAFDACAALPHVAGVVTDLDEHLGARALTCLRAEIRHRERWLRDAGVGDVRDLAGDDVLPRLLVVVDEVATLVADLPDFVSSLVDVAQRGRSLGVHLVLATQRPAGAITADIRANTDVAVALRVADATDSTDIVGVPDAAALPRQRPGLAILRRGAEPPRRFQAAWTAAPHLPGGLRVQPLSTTVPPTAAESEQDLPDGDAPPGARTDLARLVDACGEAAADLPPPRCPWPEPLPDRLTPEALDEVAAPDGAGGDGGVPLGLADEPRRQRRVPLTVDPDRGTLALIGRREAGPGDTLVTLALQVAARHSPDTCHLYGIDHDAGRLAPLEVLPHVGAIISAGERERQRRLVSMLAGEVTERRAHGRAPGDGTTPRVHLLLAGAAGFLRTFDDPAGMAVCTALEEIARDGPAVGVHLAVTAQRPGDLSTGVLASAGTRLAFALADPYDHTTLGLRTAPPARPRGRALQPPDGREVQLAAVPDPAARAAAVAAAAGSPVAGPAEIGRLEETVALAELGPGAAAGADAPDHDGVWRPAIGMDSDTLAPTGPDLVPGDHMLVAGPPRSGRTTVLRTLAHRAADAGLEVFAVTPAGGPLRGDPRPIPLGAGQREDLRDAASGRSVVLIDDVERLTDHDWLAGLLEDAGDVHVIAAGRGDVLRAAPPVWLRRLSGSGVGLCLRPDLEADGALWGTVLPRQPPEIDWPPGRGLLLQWGRARLLQVARP